MLNYSRNSKVALAWLLSLCLVVTLGMPVFAFAEDADYLEPFVTDEFEYGDDGMTLFSDDYKPVQGDFVMAVTFSSLQMIDSGLLVSNMRTAGNLAGKSLGGGPGQVGAVAVTEVVTTVGSVVAIPGKLAAGTYYARINVQANLGVNDEVLAPGLWVLFRVANEKTPTDADFVVKLTPSAAVATSKTEIKNAIQTATSPGQFSGMAISALGDITLVSIVDNATSSEAISLSPMLLSTPGSYTVEFDIASKINGNLTGTGLIAYFTVKDDVAPTDADFRMAFTPSSVVITSVTEIQNGIVTATSPGQFSGMAMSMLGDITVTSIMKNMPASEEAINMPIRRLTAGSYTVTFDIAAKAGVNQAETGLSVAMAVEDDKVPVGTNFRIALTPSATVAVSKLDIQSAIKPATGGPFEGKTPGINMGAVLVNEVYQFGSLVNVALPKILTAGPYEASVTVMTLAGVNTRAEGIRIPFNVTGDVVPRGEHFTMSASFKSIETYGLSNIKDRIIALPTGPFSDTGIKAPGMITVTDVYADATSFAAINVITIPRKLTAGAYWAKFNVAAKPGVNAPVNGIFVKLTVADDPLPVSSDFRAPFTPSAAVTVSKADIKNAIRTVSPGQFLALDISALGNITVTQVYESGNTQDVLPGAGAKKLTAGAYTARFSIAEQANVNRAVTGLEVTFNVIDDLMPNAGDFILPFTASAAVAVSKAEIGNAIRTNSPGAFQGMNISSLGAVTVTQVFASSGATDVLAVPRMLSVGTYWAVFNVEEKPGTNTEAIELYIAFNSSLDPVPVAADFFIPTVKSGQLFTVADIAAKVEAASPGALKGKIPGTVTVKRVFEIGGSNAVTMPKRLTSGAYWVELDVATKAGVNAGATGLTVPMTINDHGPRLYSDYTVLSAASVAAQMPVTEGEDLSFWFSNIDCLGINLVHGDRHQNPSGTTLIRPYDYFNYPAMNPATGRSSFIAKLSEAGIEVWLSGGGVGKRPANWKLFIAPDGTWGEDKWEMLSLAHHGAEVWFSSAAMNNPLQKAFTLEVIPLPDDFVDFIPYGNRVASDEYFYAGPYKPGDAFEMDYLVVALMSVDAGNRVTPGALTPSVIYSLTYNYDYAFDVTGFKLLASGGGLGAGNMEQLKEWEILGLKHNGAELWLEHETLGVKPIRSTHVNVGPVGEVIKLEVEIACGCDCPDCVADVNGCEGTKCDMVHCECDHHYGSYVEAVTNNVGTYGFRLVFSDTLYRTDSGEDDDMVANNADMRSYFEYKRQPGSTGTIMAASYNRNNNWVTFTISGIVTKGDRITMIPGKLYGWLGAEALWQDDIVYDGKYWDWVELRFYTDYVVVSAASVAARMPVVEGEDLSFWYDSSTYLGISMTHGFGHQTPGGVTMIRAYDYFNYPNMNPATGRSSFIAKLSDAGIEVWLSGGGIGKRPANWRFFIAPDGTWGEDKWEMLSLAHDGAEVWFSSAAMNNPLQKAFTLEVIPLPDDFVDFVPYGSRLGSGEYLYAGPYEPGDAFEMDYLVVALMSVDAGDRTTPGDLASSVIHSINYNYDDVFDMTGFKLLASGGGLGAGNTEQLKEWGILGLRHDGAQLWMEHETLGAKPVKSSHTDMGPVGSIITLEVEIACGCDCPDCVADVNGCEGTKCDMVHCDCDHHYGPSVEEVTNNVGTYGFRLVFSDTLYRTTSGENADRVANNADMRSYFEYKRQPGSTGTIMAASYNRNNNWVTFTISGIVTKGDKITMIPGKLYGWLGAEALWQDDIVYDGECWDWADRRFYTDYVVVSAAALDTLYVDGENLAFWYDSRTYLGISMTHGFGHQTPGGVTMIRAYDYFNYPNMNPAIGRSSFIAKLRDAGFEMWFSGGSIGKRPVESDFFIAPDGTWGMDQWEMLTPTHNGAEVWLSNAAMDTPFYKLWTLEVKPMPTNFADFLAYGRRDATDEYFWTQYEVGEALELDYMEVCLMSAAATGYLTPGALSASVIHRIDSNYDYSFSRAGLRLIASGGGLGIGKIEPLYEWQALKEKHDGVELWISHASLGVRPVRSTHTVMGPVGSVVKLEVYATPYVTGIDMNISPGSFRTTFTQELYKASGAGFTRLVNGEDVKALFNYGRETGSTGTIASAVYSNSGGVGRVTFTIKGVVKTCDFISLVPGKLFSEFGTEAECGVIFKQEGKWDFEGPWVDDIDQNPASGGAFRLIFSEELYNSVGGRFMIGADVTASFSYIQKTGSTGVITSAIYSRTGGVGRIEFMVGGAVKIGDAISLLPGRMFNANGVAADWRKYVVYDGTGWSLKDELNDTYPISFITDMVTVNGVIAVGAVSPAEQAAGQPVTVTIRLISGAAIETGTHTIGLSGADAGTIKPASVTKAVTAGQIVTNDAFNFTFTMPENAVTNLVVQHKFNAAPSAITDIVIEVTEPVAGANPDDTVDIDESDDFTASTAIWSPGDTKFKNGVEYTVMVRLTAKNGYTFDGLSAMTINGEAATGIVGSKGKTLTISREFTASAGTTPNDLEKINDPEIMVTAPAVGANPDDTVKIVGEPADFTASTAIWSPGDAKFKNGMKYTVMVRLTAKNGYTFDGLSAAKINGETATLVSNTGNTVTLSYEFTAIAGTTTNDFEKINDPEIMVTAPAVGVNPDDTVKIIGEPADFTASTAIWSPGDAKFKNGVEYTVVVRLTAKNGYTFDGLSAAKINGETATLVSNTGNTVTLSYEFTAIAGTTTNDFEKINDPEIMVTAPAVGANPDAAVKIVGETDSFTASTAIWSPGDAKFKSGVAYTVTVRLTAKAGYTFDGLSAVTLNGETATIVSNTGKAVTILYTFVN